MIIDLKKWVFASAFVTCLSCGVSYAEVIERTLPQEVSGIKDECILLNGTWDFRFDNKSKWEKVIVPGELAMQGYAIEHDKPVTYRKIVTVPADFQGKRVILRFDGVYSFARLWVNDQLVTEHFGGFTRWESDITSLVKTGKKNEIRLEVTDRIDDISYASGYAHHPIGGILRDVVLYALPEAHLENFFVEAQPDSLFQDGELRIGYKLTRAADIQFKLFDPQGKEMHLTNAKQSMNAGTGENRFQISKPQLWDAEHPNLYRIEVYVDGKDDYSFSREIGFRKVEIRGKEMLVNGKPVKLRGACRHDMHPTLGRTTTAELDSLDAVLFKQANMNFVRTSHYPPTERFLSYCDRVGLYVECETAVCFVNTHRQKNYAPAASQDDPAFTGRYLNQLQEMVHSFRFHSSILFWSVGNESQYGINFQQSYDWVKQTDCTRPAVFSYPGYVPEGKQVYDIVSMHYPGCDGNLHQLGTQTFGFEHKDKPALFDEWAHVPCYTYSTLQDDPNIREFWGISLDKMWSKLFASNGGLGGAIWGYVDETFMLPVPKKGSPYWIEFAHTAKPDGFRGNCVGYGEWGIVDVWRREKPEFWGTKKAYSPVRLEQTQVNDITSGLPVSLVVYNRFDHTNLNEIRVRLTVNGKQQMIDSPFVEPHKKGILSLPSHNWKSGDDILVEFLTQTNELIDKECITLGRVPDSTWTKVNSTTASLKIKEDENRLVVYGAHFTIPFNKQNGLIEKAVSRGKVVIERGPFLNLDLNVSHKTGPEVREKAPNYIVADSDWKLKNFNYQQRGEDVYVTICGEYVKAASVSISPEFEVEVRITPKGEMYFSYKTTGEPNGWLREAGLKFHLSDALQTLSWKRTGYWSCYPAESMSGNVGKVALYNSKQVAYGEDPKQPWNLDTYNYYYFADAGAVSKTPLTNAAKAMKENILYYMLQDGAGESSLAIRSAGSEVACRLNKPDGEALMLYVNNRWDYPEIAWGDYCKALEVTPVFGNLKIEL